MAARLAMTERAIRDGYTADAAELIPRFEALRPEEVLAPVLDLLPKAPSSVLEVGAGTGRDAAWLAARGHQVVAVEPVEALRHAGMALHRCPNITWLDDHLPALEETRRRGERYEFVLAVAVWQHLRPDDQAAAIATVAGLTAAKGRLILSLRHGSGSPARPCFPCDLERIISAAEHAGLRLILRRHTPSVQQKNRQAGVTWTWLGFERPD